MNVAHLKPLSLLSEPRLKVTEYYQILEGPINYLKELSELASIALPDWKQRNMKRNKACFRPSHDNNFMNS
jgi:hypothetical protein